MGDIAGRSVDASKSTVTNVIDDPSVSLQRLRPARPAALHQEKVYATSASKDFHLFYVGRDDVHDILKHVLSRVSVSLYLNMFGFDDGELNDILMKIALDATITMLVTLDKSQPAERTRRPCSISTGSTTSRCSTPTSSPRRMCRSSSSASRPPTRSAIPKASSPTAGSPERDRPTGRSPERVPLSSRGAPAAPATKHRTTPVDHHRSDTISRFSSEQVAEHMVAQKQAAGVKGGRQPALESQGRESAFGGQTRGAASRVDSPLKRAAL